MQLSCVQAKNNDDATRNYLQTGAQLWVDLTSTTGGIIDLHKIGWQMLAIDESTFQPKIQKNSSGNIWLRDAFDSKTRIQKMMHTTLNKGLGYHQSVDGKMKVEYAF